MPGLIIAKYLIFDELIMVTENISEFERISNIKIENWIERK
jgi:predicted nucleic acid-binding protein